MALRRPPSGNGSAPPAGGGGRDLRVAGVRHRYPTKDGGLLALDRIDLEIGAGEFVCLVGPSGCGKTTLLQLLAGFFPPTEGTIAMGGERVERPGHERGVVFQHATSLYPWLSVRSNVELGLRLRRVPRSVRRSRVDDELHRVGLLEFADRASYELSGGMQQRCQIARVLANDPDVMLMDEPFGALDALTREHLQAELRRIWQETGRTVVFITHSVEEAVVLGTRVLVMSPRPGRIVLDEPVGFARSPAAFGDLRADPVFVDACVRVRAAIEHRRP
jgi:ABC-type nitrate/sulfonate/bicarbonate transport system ATPase subunit